MKKIIALMIVVLAVVMTGCSEVEDKSLWNSDFVIVEENYKYYIVYHKETKVMYTVSYNNGVFTLLVNADGTPMLWEGE